MPSPDPVVRPAEQVTAAMKAAVDWLAQSDEPQWVRGVIAAYAWVSGQLRVAPVSGEPVEITLEAIRHEERLADDVIYRLPGASPVDPQFAGGAQNALLWLRGADPHPPISLTNLATPGVHSR